MEYARSDDFELNRSTPISEPYGGYTGMKPVDFKNPVTSLAWQNRLNPDKIILGGDHLGPDAFKDRDGEEAIAMPRVFEAFVEAGFEKIHIDTSMRLGRPN
jgi:D-tagatose-1,6-bisphosphate aldolase subunit GatZ/KbaZ